MPSDEPPPYPGLPSGDQQQQNQQTQQQHPQAPQDNSHYNEETELSDDEEPSSRHLQVPNVPGMDEASRRSMEDEERPLPEGWVRQFDVNQDHHFYVDLRASPPRSTWHHPFDDPEYLQSIPDSDAAAARRLADDDGDSEVAHSARLNQQKKDEDENRSLGTKIKDKITGTTKKERDEKKRKEIAQERARQKQMQLLFLQRRAALRQAQTTRLNDPYVQRYYPNTGRVYAPPMGVYSRPAFGFGNYGGYGGFGYGGRPGFGAPMMMGGLGGLGAGMLMGGAMGGGYGGGFGGDCGGGGGGGDCGGGGGGC